MDLRFGHSHSLRPHGLHRGIPPLRDYEFDESCDRPFGGMPGPRRKNSPYHDLFFFQR